MPSRPFTAGSRRDSIYRRYFSPKPELSDRDLDHFTHIDMTDRVALAVESHGEFIAWSSYERWPGRSEAEAAFMVDDDHQGEGIATLMLEHLAAIARSNGIDRFTAEVLADNRPMLAVFAKAGWPLQRRFDSGVVDLDWELATTEEFLDSVERREQRADSPRRRAAPDPAGDRRDRRVRPAGIGRRRDLGQRHGQRDRAESMRSTRHGPCSATIRATRPSRSSRRRLPGDRRRAGATPRRHDRRLHRQAHARRRRDHVGRRHRRRRRRRWSVRARRNGLRIIGPSSMGVASPRPDVVAAGRPRPGHAAGRSRRDLDAIRVARQLAAAPRPRPRSRHLLVRLTRRQGRRLGQRPPAVLGGGHEHPRGGDVHRVVRQPAQVRADRPASLADQADRRGPHRVPRRSVAASSALYQQAGVIEVPTVPALLDTARVLATQPHPRGPNIAVISNSRSPTVLAVAALEHAGLIAVDPPRRARLALVGHRLRGRDRDGARRRGDPRTPRDPRSGGRTMTSTRPRRTSTGRPAAPPSRSSPCCSGASTVRSCRVRRFRHSPSRSRRPPSSDTPMRTGVGW